MEKVHAHNFFGTFLKTFSTDLKLAWNSAFFDTFFDLKKKCLGHISSFFKLWSQTRKKLLKKTKNLFYEHALEFSYATRCTLLSMCSRPLGKGGSAAILDYRWFKDIPNGSYGPKRWLFSAEKLSCQRTHHLLEFRSCHKKRRKTTRENRELAVKAMLASKWRGLPHLYLFIWVFTWVLRPRLGSPSTTQEIWEGGLEFSACNREGF